MTGCVQLVSEVLNDSAQLFPLIESTSSPSPSSSAQDENSPAEEGNFLADWGVILGTLLGIGGTLLTQLLSSKREKKSLERQNAREDAKNRREELKLSYAELLRLLDKHVHLSVRHNGGKESVRAVSALDRGTAGREELLRKYEVIADERLDNSASFFSTLAIVDLLEEDEVYFFALEYMKAISKLDGTTQRRDTTKAYGDIMKIAMRLSLKGERLPEQYRPEKFEPQVDEEEAETIQKDEPQKQK